MSTIKDIYNNEELVNYITEDLDDFDADTEVTYEIWALGYNCDDEPTDFEVFIDGFADPDKAIEKANTLTLAEVVGNTSLCEIKSIVIEIETVVEDEEGTMNIGTVYRKKLWPTYDDNTEESVEEPEPIVELCETDYSLLEDGTLKISCNLLKEYNKNDFVKVKFVGEPDCSVFTYRIMSKVICEDGDYFYCDFTF